MIRMRVRIVMWVRGRSEVRFDSAKISVKSKTV